MEKEVQRLLENIKTVQSTRDVAVEYDDLISGRVPISDNEAMPAGFLSLAISDTRNTLYRIAQFINLSNLGELIQYNNDEKKHMDFIDNVFGQIINRQAEVVKALIDVIQNNVYFQQGKIGSKSIGPLVLEQLEELGKHARIADSTAKKVREGRKK